MTQIKRSGVRRRVQMRSALLLCAAAFVLNMSVGGTLRLLGLPQTSFTEPLIRALTGLLSFGLPAYLGLFVLDGDHRELLPSQQLGRGAILPLVLTGALMICPAILLEELNGLLATGVQAVPEAAQKITDAQRTALSLSAFLPMALEAAILAPVLEEIFFRGYLMGTFLRAGKREAVILTAGLFALMHGVSSALPGHLLLGLLLGAVVLHSGSIFASMIVHSAYNLTLLLGGSLGLFPEKMNPFFAALLLAGVLALFSCMRALWKAQRPRTKSIFMASMKLKKRDMRRIAAAILALILLIPASEWMVRHWENAVEWAAMQKMEEKGEAK